MLADSEDILEGCIEVALDDATMFDTESSEQLLMNLCALSLYRCKRHTI